MYKVLVSILFFLGCYGMVAQTTEDLAVQLSATVIESPPTITLHWNNISFGSPDYRIYKKTKTDTAWGNAIDTLPMGSNYYVDSSNFWSDWNDGGFAIVNFTILLNYIVKF